MGDVENVAVDEVLLVTACDFVAETSSESDVEYDNVAVGVLVGRCVGVSKCVGLADADLL